MKCLLAKLNGNGGGALLWAALNGNSEGVKRLLDFGVDVNSTCDIIFFHYFPYFKICNFHLCTFKTIQNFLVIGIFQSSKVK